MKMWIMGALLMVALSSFAHAQFTTAPPATGHFIESDTTVGTSWDSVYVGNVNFVKWLEVLNDGSVSLYLAFGNDTSTAKPSSHKWITVKSGEKFFLSLANGRYFIRTKAASATCSRRVHAGYQ